MWSHSSFAAPAAVLAIIASVEASLYTKNSPVIQVDASSYNRLISKSNHTSLVEFYAPWCGHCQKLAPAFEKTARNLKGLAKVAGINCDDELNKPFCGQMGVKGFPTLKIVRPSKRSGKPTVEEYTGARTAKALVDAVVGKIPNHVKRVTDKSLEPWLKESNETSKAILFTEKGTTSALLRALAIDYLGSVNFGQIRSKEANAVETFGIDTFPKFLILPGGDKDAIMYDGDLKKDPMSEFLKQVATPNPDPAPESLKKKGGKTKHEKKSKVSEGEKPKDPKVSQEKEEDNPEEKKDEDKPAKVQQKQVAVIPVIDENMLSILCLTSSSKICALILLPAIADKSQMPQGIVDALKSFGEVYDKHSKRHSGFPFYIIEETNPGSKLLRNALGLKDTSELEIIAVNAKRMWWRNYPGQEYSHDAVEAWVDAIRMNEGKRDKLPESLVTETPEEQDEDIPQPPKKDADDDENKAQRDDHDEL